MAEYFVWFYYAKWSKKFQMICTNVSELSKDVTGLNPTINAYV